VCVICFYVYVTALCQSMTLVVPSFDDKLQILVLSHFVFSSVSSN